MELLYLELEEVVKQHLDEEYWYEQYSKNIATDLLKWSGKNTMDINGKETSTIQE